MLLISIYVVLRFYTKLNVRKSFDVEDCEEQREADVLADLYQSYIIEEKSVDKTTVKDFVILSSVLCAARL